MTTNNNISQADTNPHNDLPWKCADCGGKAAGVPTQCCGAGVFDPEEKAKPGTLHCPWLWLPDGANPTPSRRTSQKQ